MVLKHRELIENILEKLWKTTRDLSNTELESIDDVIRDYLSE